MTQRQLNSEQLNFQKKMTQSWLLRLFLLFKIPLGFLAGMRVTELSQDRAISTVPFKWLNRNPFKSMYFGVQGMAAELSTGCIALMAIRGYSPSIAGIITGFEGKFFKQAKGKIHFTCEQGEAIFSAVDQCITTQEGQTVSVKTTGRTQDGTIVSEFNFIWSFKQRSK